MDFKNRKSAMCFVVVRREFHHVPPHENKIGNFKKYPWRYIGRSVWKQWLPRMDGSPGEVGEVL